MLFRKRKKLKGFEIHPEEVFLDSMNPLGFDMSRHEGRIEKSIHPSSGAMVFLLALLFLGVLLGRIGILQIARGDEFSSQALGQSVLVSTINPPRGQIVDKDGALLAGNEISFDLVLYRSEFLKSGMSLDEFWNNAAVIPGFSAGGDSSEKFEEGGYIPRFISELPQEFTVVRNADQQTLLAAEAHREKLPGLFPEERFRRVYQKGAAFATLIGYTGIPTKNDIDVARDITPATVIGKLGLERYYNALLTGVAGRKISEIDARRTVRRVKTVKEYELGKTLRLSIDGELQKKAYEVLESFIKSSGKRAGAVVILDPRNGALRALVSYPSFENNIFSTSLSWRDVENIFLHPDKPLFNRAVSGEYPPGSIIKPVIASGALQEHIIDPRKQIFSAGFIRIPNPFRAGEFSTFLDWKPLGWMDMRNALAFSSNVYFYSIGGGYESQQGLGIDRIKKYEKLFGLGGKLGIDFPNEGSGFIPDPLWKAEKKANDPLWRVGDTYNVSIGQGDTLVTPLQVAGYTAVFANRGTLYRPYLLAEIIDPETKKLLQKTAPAVIRSDFLDAETLEVVREGMRMAVTEGTARRLQQVPVAVAGKTGTAETGRINEAHAWFTGFAPYENPELVITVLVEKGGEGSAISVPIATEILKWYFTRPISHPEAN